MVRSKPKVIGPGFFKIRNLDISESNFYLDKKGRVFWSESELPPRPLSQLPKRLQMQFLIIFIQNHDLSERLKGIEQPLTCIELYLKAKFIVNH